MCLLFSDHVCTDPGQLAFVFLPSRRGGGGKDAEGGEAGCVRFGNSNLLLE